MKRRNIELTQNEIDLYKYLYEQYTHEKSMSNFNSTKKISYQYYKSPPTKFIFMVCKLHNHYQISLMTCKKKIFMNNLQYIIKKYQASEKNKSIIIF